MARAGRGGFRIKQRLTVERAFQNRFQTLIREGLELEGALAGGFQSWLGVDFLQTQDAQTGAVAHLRVRLALQDGTDDFGSGNANAFGPMNQSRLVHSRCAWWLLGIGSDTVVWP